MKKTIQGFLKQIFKSRGSKLATRNSEKGIALIMTLGILSMLLVLALAFASSARTERKASAASASLVQARLLAESALQRVAALAEFYSDIASHCDSNTHDNNALPISTKSWNSDNEGTKDWIHHLATTNYLGSELLAWFKPGASLTSNSNITYGDINWEYIFTSVDGNNDGDLSDPEDYNKIIGRIAYTLVPESGIDPAALVASGVNENGANENRFGVSLTEINIASLNDQANTNKMWPDFLTTTNVQKFSWASNASGTFEDASWYGPTPEVNGAGNTGTSWPDFTTMLDNAHVDISVADYQNALKSWFVETPVASDEKFWLDKDTDGEREAGEYFHRFNLARPSASWDDLDGDGNSNGVGDVGVIMGTAPPTGGSATIPWVWNLDGGEDGTTSGTKTDPDYRTCNGCSIPWIANWADDGAGNGNFADANTRGKQIAANLIDYCDSDSIPTSDQPSNTWTNVIKPTYTGNEKTQYLNEIYFEIKGNLSQDQASPTTRNEYIVSISCSAETVDIYGAQPAVDVFVAGTVEFDYLNADGGTQHYSDTFDQQITSAGDNTGDPNFDIRTKVVLSPTYNSPYTPDAGGLTNPEIKNILVSLTSVRVKIGSDGVDYSIITSAPEAASGSIGPGGLAAKDFFASYSWQIEDPRHNLHAADWTPVTKYNGDTSVDAAAISSLGINNKNSDPSASDKDLEAATSVISLSTAFIPNAPMVSPWELGAIHRGAKWETINLKEYNMATGVSNTGGGSKYTDDTGDADVTNDNGGDANILDQIKMVPQTQTPMKVSYSVSAANDILYALLDKIRIGANWNNIATSGNQITGTGVANVVTAINNSSTNFITRASVANSLTTANKWALTDSICGQVQDTDAKQEELIGKFINLTTMNSSTATSQSDYFTSIIVAQSINDIGGNGADIVIFKDLDGDGDIDGSVDETAAGWDIDGLDNNVSSGTAKYYNFDGYANDTSVNLPASCVSSNPEKINAQLGRYDQYADEILGEQKMKVQLYKHPATSSTPGKIEIISVEYLNN